MKYCPKCQSRYTDDTLAFCLSDGERLVDSLSENELTLPRGSAPTEIISAAQTAENSSPPELAPTIAAPEPLSDAVAAPPQNYQAQIPQHALAAPAPREKSNLVRYLLVALVALLLGGAGAGVVFFFFNANTNDEALNSSNLGGGRNSQVNVGVPSPTPVPTPMPSPAVMPNDINSNSPQSKCVLTNSGGRQINLRADCDRSSCDNDQTTIVDGLPAGTPVRRTNAAPVRGKRFIWVQITLIDTGEIGWVAADKVSCK